MKPRVLCVIPARSGSKRIPGKNAKLFLGKPLISYTIRQALKVPFVNRVIVDTDSSSIAKIAQKYGAEVPFLRPKYLATDKAKVMDSILHLLGRLAKEGYRPDYILLLQTTSPLRELRDIEACWKRMQKGDATTVLTVCPTHPQLYYLGPNDDVILANKIMAESSNTQSWREGYLLNGCFVYLMKTEALLREKKILTKKTKAVVCPRWRSVDLDVPEDWVMGELLYKNRAKIEKALQHFK